MSDSFYSDDDSQMQEAELDLIMTDNDIDLKMREYDLKTNEVYEKI